MPQLAHQITPPIEYPESDGKPMAETDDHRDEMSDLIKVLKERFRDHDDVYVSGNLLLYYEEGNPAARRAPDVFVVRGVPKRQRRIYKLWEEGRPPSMVIELTSRGTRGEDMGPKRELYARLGVEEYFLFDPLGEYLRPRLQGWRLVRGTYRPILATAGEPLPCRTLGLKLQAHQGRLAVIDAATGEELPRWDEVREDLVHSRQARREAEERATAEAEARRQAEKRAVQAEERATAEAEARREAEERASRLAEELERLRAQSELPGSRSGRSMSGP